MDSFYDDAMKTARPIKADERASRAEMKFAGYYLNLGGVLLLLVGLVSYLKSAAPGGFSAMASGTLETLLGAGLGLVLLVAGELFHQKKNGSFGHPISTAGFCLLFFVICSAHFRHNLIGGAALFMLLLPLVFASNASVFRYDSKLLGNAMSVVYFSAPLVMSFGFQNFSGLLLYLLAINAGTALVAWRKKWDFQLVISCLGSYGFFFLHGKQGTPMQVMALLLVIYTLSFIANNTIFFTRPETSKFNLVTSFVNPIAFAAFSSSAMVFHFSNWVPVCLYVTLACGHAAVAWMADSRRKENQDFKELATNNILLSLLFLCAGISFITYFADDTTYFTLVTLLWFAMAHSLLQAGLLVARHRILASRFSLFTLALATFQVYYVVSSMDSALALKSTCAALFLGYYVALYLGRNSLNDEQVIFCKISLVLLVSSIAVVTTLVPYASVSMVLLLVPGTALIHAARRYPGLDYLNLAGYGLSGYAVWCGLQAWTSNDAFWFVLPIVTTAFIAYLYKAEASGYEWFYGALLVCKCLFLPVTHSPEALLISMTFGQILLAALALVSKQETLFRKLFDLSGVVVLILAMQVSVPAGLAGGVLALAALAVARRWEAKLEPSHTLSAAAIWGRMLVLAFLQQPLAVLSLLAVGSAVAMKAGRERLSLGLLAGNAVGLAVLPLGSWLDGWNLLGLAVVAASSFHIYFVARKQSPSYAVERLEALGSLLLLRLSFSFIASPLSTLLWVVLAAILLRHSAKEERNWNLLGQGAFDLARLLLFGAFLKSIVYDANFVTHVGTLHTPIALLVSAVFLAIAHTLILKQEARNALVVAGLLTLCFQLTFLLHGLWGYHDLAQPLLSGFWSFTAFGVIAAGVFLQVKAYRLFGLCTMVASVLKILVVDIHVLDAYSQTNTYLILGSLLISTSLLYQKQTERLTGESGLAVAASR